MPGYLPCPFLSIRRLALLILIYRYPVTQALPQTLPSAPASLTSGTQLWNVSYPVPLSSGSADKNQTVATCSKTSSILNYRNQTSTDLQTFVSALSSLTLKESASSTFSLSISSNSAKTTAVSSGVPPDSENRQNPAEGTSPFPSSQKGSVVTLTSSGRVVQSLPPPNNTPNLKGTIYTTLDCAGHRTVQPFPTCQIPAPTTTITSRHTVTVTYHYPEQIPFQDRSSTINSGSLPKTEMSQKPLTQSKALAPDIFQPISTSAPPSQIGSRPDHPVPRLGIVAQSSPIPTNKFYANLFLGGQNQGVWTHPYSVSWSKGSGNAASWGMSVSHIDADQLAFGPGTPAQYFINPIGLQSIVLSATSLTSTTTLTTDSLGAFSANVNLLPSAGAQPAITFPLVQGMGFVTAIYTGSVPVLQSSIFFRTVTQVTSPQQGITKYKIVLEDGKTWLAYASGPAINLQVVSNSLVQADAAFNGTIQVAKNPGDNAAGEAVYDAAAGAYATSATVSGSVSGTTGTYSLQWAKAGLTNKTLLMFALPHHVQSFDDATAAKKTPIQLNTTTKGSATAVAADAFTLVEPNMPTDMGFAPWTPQARSQSNFSTSAISAINNVATSEVSQDINGQTNLDSMYFSGKGLAKFAQIVYVLNDLSKNSSLAQTGLANLKTAFAVFVNNKQKYPLVYETAWKGVVSTGSYVTGDSGQDFGNTYYNDHHFHYGYFIYAASIIGYLDSSWLAGNADWVNTLVRDAANPSTSDTFFPFSRSFDWFHGHSWAKGLFESADGKDEESSSEDALFSYAVKMWGKTIGDANMEARGNLMLSIQARSLQNYFLMQSNNTNHPANFIGNKVTGILFENKADHVTYFGTNTEYIQGIHMIPLAPFSTLTRTPTFVTEEWNTYFSNGRVDSVAGGWRGILYANYAIINPAAAWSFFTAQAFDAGWLDGGASRTWYLAWVAGLGGAPS